MQENIAETSVDADRSEEDQERQSHEMAREFDTTVPYDDRYVTEQEIPAVFLTENERFAE